MKATSGDIMAWTRGRILSGALTASPTGVSIDSRTIDAGEAFFAIRGKTHDGHDHVHEAATRGASLLVVHDAGVAERLAAGGRSVLLVADTTRALQDAAGALRARSGATVLGITGSAGKTTTKELTRLLLSGDRRAHASPGNLNNHYGLPLALLAMPDDCEACVLELGISTPGEMDRLVEISAPDHGLITVIATAHVGNFTTFAQLADEKMKLAHGSAVAHLDADDEAQWSRRKGLRRVVPRGTSEQAAGGVRLLSRRPRGLDGSSLTLEAALPDGARRIFGLDLPLPGEHQSRNLLAAASLALAVGVSPVVVARQAAEARPAPHRGEVLRLGGVTVIDDSYNANPRAMRAALGLLAETAAIGRRVAVLGDMLELGASAEAEHRRLGEKVSEMGLDVVLGVGPESAALVAAAHERGTAAHHVADADAAGAWLAASLVPGDVVLVKGSRGVGLDQAVARIAGERGTA